MPSSVVARAGFDPGSSPIRRGDDHHGRLRRRSSARSNAGASTGSALRVRGGADDHHRAARALGDAGGRRCRQRLRARADARSARRRGRRRRRGCAGRAGRARPRARSRRRRRGRRGRSRPSGSWTTWVSSSGAPARSAAALAAVITVVPASVSSTPQRTMLCVMPAMGVRLQGTPWGVLPNCEPLESCVAMGMPETLHKLLTAAGPVRLRAGPGRGLPRGRGRLRRGHARHGGLHRGARARNRRGPVGRDRRAHRRDRPDRPPHRRRRVPVVHRRRRLGPDHPRRPAGGDRHALRASSPASSARSRST